MLTLMCKIVNRDAPSYLIDVLPNRVNSITAYNLRNSDDFEIHFPDFAHTSRHFIAMERIRLTSSYTSNNITIQIKYQDHTR